MTFVEILDQLGIEYKRAGEHSHVRDGWVGINCPWCIGSKVGFRLGYSLERGGMSCWACGPHNVAETLAMISGEKVGAIARLLYKTAHTFRTPTSRSNGTLRVPKGLGPLLAPHRNYVENRGVSSEDLEQLWGVQAIGLAVRLPWRLYIPVKLNGITLSWTTRGITNETRYISASPEEEVVAHKSLLLGEDLCGHSVIVTEGPFDAFRIGPGAVAVFGTSYSKAQVNRLASFAVRAVCFDNERAARERARQLCRELKSHQGSTYLVEIDAKDPGSCDEEELEEIRRRFLC